MLVLGGGLAAVISLLFTPLALVALWHRVGLREDDVPVYMRAPSQGYAPAYPVSGRHGAVASEVDVCSNVGAYILKRGGSAADSSIATALCVGVVDTFHSGLGGGGFALVKERGTDAVMYDYRERAPGAAHKRMFDHMSPEASRWGGLAVTVPGEVRGYEALHREHGRLAWHELFEPAAEIAARGFKVTPLLHLAIDEAKQGVCVVEPLRRVYCPGGRVRQPGEHLMLPELAQTLRRIGAEGPDAFYYGDIAERTVNATQIAGGILTIADLAAYKPVRRAAQSIELYGRHRVWATTAPSSGSVLLSALQTYANFPEEPYEVTDTLATHRLIEATKFAYGERAELGDPAYVHNATAFERQMVSPKEGERRFRQIHDDRVERWPYYMWGNHSGTTWDAGTSHISVVDASGMAVSMTTTNNLYFGSLVLTPDGILLNNDMDDFSRPDTPNAFGYAPTPANYIHSGKRPMSSMAPAIVESLRTGELELVTGSAGGSRIITANILSIIGYLTQRGERNLQRVFDRPRWHHQLLPPEAIFEYPVPILPRRIAYDNATVGALAQLGHNVSWIEPGHSAAQGIELRADGTMHAAAELRQITARGAAIA